MSLTYLSIFYFHWTITLTLSRNSSMRLSDTDETLTLSPRQKIKSNHDITGAWRGNPVLGLFLVKGQLRLGKRTVFVQPMRPPPPLPGEDTIFTWGGRAGKTLVKYPFPRIWEFSASRLRSFFPTVFISLWSHACHPCSSASTDPSTTYFAF